MTCNMNRILVIAGTDSSGGAGLSRDVAMAQSLQCSVSPVVTAVTAQTDSAVLSIQPLAPEMVAAQIETACVDPATRPRVVKIGMLGTAGIADAVAQSLPKELPIVLDPVLKSSSGGALMTMECLEPLLSRVTLLTPNLLESAQLSGTPLQQDLASLRRQAQILQNMGPDAVLIKGGHGSGNQASDDLFCDDLHRRFSSPRLPVQKRGTGCSLATAISCELAKGNDLVAACAKGRAAVLRWLQE